MATTKARLLFRTALATGLVAVSVCAVAFTGIRHPRTDPLGDPDAYYVLASRGGSDALENLADWSDPNKPLMVSVTETRMKMPIYQDLCAVTDRPIICVEPPLPSTQGEARNLGRLAHKHGWRSVAVISHRSHLTRARILMKRCFDGEVRMVARNVEHGPRTWGRALVYESVALVKTLATPRC
ncbi:MAG TPA: hypothetical protein GXZ30_15405 [Propionibacterium sp.]|jgi:hypothetical protein|nr:hypothetical protein [Propionibacterium sp.]